MLKAAAVPEEDAEGGIGATPGGTKGSEGFELAQRLEERLRASEGEPGSFQGGILTALKGNNLLTWTRAVGTNLSNSVSD